MKLKDKTAIITGGTGALGRAVVETFLEEGAAVVCPYIIEEEYKECSSIFDKYDEKVVFLKADLSEENDVKELVEESLNAFARIDILANIAGGFEMDKIVDTDVEMWDKMMNMNLRSAFLCCKHVLPHMIENKYGKVINITSRPGLNGGANMGAYAASKAGVMNLTKTISEEVLEYDINVNAIVPGTIDTPQNREDMPDTDFSKWVKPEDIAKVIVFICSEDAKLISGTAVPVFGKS